MIDQKSIAAGEYIVLTAVTVPEVVIVHVVVLAWVPVEKVAVDSGIIIAKGQVFARATKTMTGSKTMSLAASIEVITGPATTTTALMVEVHL